MFCSFNFLFFCLIFVGKWEGEVEGFLRGIEGLTLGMC